MALISKKVMNFAYGMGAAVVIVGALFKIQHWTGGSELLVVGLLTEAFIFALSAFDNSDEELDWTLVYPELAGGEAKQKSKKT
ncbi:MAG TPA: gliding motility protein GldL, partial [Flavobacterium sp.]|nr:gliding motility protein GldL [Flavobacterium sp.]